jgi:anaerobic ribonucleoside-triphosphate reductase activating protein
MKEKVSVNTFSDFTYTNKLNIASLVANTTALGPGQRAVIWTQGCPLNCPGCVAPNWIPFVEANLLSPEEVISKIDIEKIDGLTFSGGEPMEQAGGLAILAKLIRKKKEINLICFTGYRYERLVKNPPNSGVPELLYETDVLIDGPYIQSLNDSIGLRGSANQRIINLTQRLEMYDLDTQKRKVEVTISDGELAYVGIPTPGIKSAIDQARIAATERMDQDEWL